MQGVCETQGSQGQRLGSQLNGAGLRASLDAVRRALLVHAPAPPSAPPSFADSEPACAVREVLAALARASDSAVRPGGQPSACEWPGGACLLAALEGLEDAWRARTASLLGAPTLSTLARLIALDGKLPSGSLRHVKENLIRFGSQPLGPSLTVQACVAQVENVLTFMLGTDTALADAVGLDAMPGEPSAGDQA